MANDINVNEFKLRDPVRSIPDGLKEPVKDATPGFFQSLRNPYHLMLEESLPASLYQWITGNTKKKQAQEALNWIRNNPDQQGSKIYQEAERKLKRFGYLLEEGSLSIDFKEIGNMIKANPKMFGAELVNMIMADPWLIVMPLGWHRLGRGIVNALRYKYAKQFQVVKASTEIGKLRAASTAKEVAKLKLAAKADMKYGTIATLAVPFVFSTTWQLGEDATLSGKRTAVETTIGATAGAVFSVALSGMAAAISRETGVFPARVRQVMADTVRKTKDKSTLADIDENGFNKLINKSMDIIRKEQKVLTNDSKFNLAKAKVQAFARTSLENAEDMSINSIFKRPGDTALKAATLGGVFGTAQFLTSDDEKLMATAKGFAAGSALYLGGKVFLNTIRKHKNWDIHEKNVEHALDTMAIMQVHMNSEGQKLKNLFNKLIPDVERRKTIFYQMVRAKVDENFNYHPSAKPIHIDELTSNEKLYVTGMTRIYDDMNKIFGDEGSQLFTGTKANYLPFIWEDYIGKDPFNYLEKIYGPGKNFRFGAKATFQDINEGLEKGYKIRPGKDDPSELIRMYAFAISKALTTKQFVNFLHKNSIGNKPYIASTPLQKSLIASRDIPNYEKFTHPALLEPKRIQYRVKDLKTNKEKVISWKEFKTNPTKYKIIERQTIGDPEVLVHKGIARSIRMVFDAEDEGKLLTALTHTNFMMKRLAVGFSFFHAGALIESLWFMGANISKIGEFLNPRKTPQILRLVNEPGFYLKEFDHAITQLERLGYRDVVNFARQVGLPVSVPEDLGMDIFYRNIRRSDAILKSHFGISNNRNIEKVFRFFDRITWDRIFTAAKLHSFLSMLEKEFLFNKFGIKIKNPNRILKTDTMESMYRKARRASQVTNDAFGGQDWAKLAQAIDTPLLKRLVQTTFNPGSRGYMQLLLFAPDWTISNLRIIAKSLPLFESDPLTRRFYQYYFARAALTYGAAGSVLNYMFSGHSILENTDPTRIDLGNGEVLTFSKQLMEPFHWITDPQRTALKKIGSLPRTTIEVLTNKKYLTTKWSPNMTKKDDDAIAKGLKIGGHVGMRFLPIWLQTASQNVAEGLKRDGLSADLAADTAVDFVLGQLGHPRYKGPRTSQYKTKGLVRSPYETLF